MLNISDSTDVCTCKLIAEFRETVLALLVVSVSLDSKLVSLLRQSGKGTFFLFVNILMS